MKMHENRHHLAWIELAWTFSLQALLQLAGFPLWFKAQEKVIDITEPCEETQSWFPPMMERSWQTPSLLTHRRRICFS